MMTGSPGAAAKPTPVLMVDDRGVITRANPAAVELFGPCVGRSCSSTIRPRNPEGEVVCHKSCPRGSRDAESCWGEVQTHDKVGSLRCTAMGDVVVVRVDQLTDPPSAMRRLTPREREVLALVAKGLATPAIATHLGIERSTVRTHVEHCRMKLEARSQAEAVARAYATHQLEIG